MDMTLKERPIEVPTEWSPERVVDFRRLRLACSAKRIPIGDFLKNELTKPNFVGKVIQDDITQGDNLRSMSLLFITDFLCRNPYTENWSNMDTEFAFKPSFEILAQWSRTLWDIRGKRNKEETKKIIVFCGRSATSVYCPDSVLGPSSTYDVTVGLYKHIVDKASEDHQYKNELREALEGLIRDDLESWKSIYGDLANTWWVAQFPLWNDAVKKELGKDNGRQIEKWIYDGVCPTSTSQVVEITNVRDSRTFLGERNLPSWPTNSEATPCWQRRISARGNSRNFG